MSMRTKTRMLIVALAVSSAGETARAQLPPPPPPPPATLWSFLGIPQAKKHMQDTMINRGGRHPGLEPKPPLKAIAAVENLKSPNPAIKKAAEIKQQEDLAKQKIKAVKYLATVGCGCYNRDGGITDALMAALGDCTEDVRYETIRAISEAASKEHCENCKLRSCCSEDITKKLYEIAYELDETGCHLEPSERVREAAIAAMGVCCPGGPPAEIVEAVRKRQQNGGKDDGSGGGEIPKPLDRPSLEGLPTPATPDGEPNAIPRPVPESARRRVGSPEASTADGAPVVDASEQAMFRDDGATPQVRPTAGFVAAPEANLAPHGVVRWVQVDRGLVEIGFPVDQQARIGDMATAFHNYTFAGRSVVAELQVVEVLAGGAVLRVNGLRGASRVSAGDEVVFNR